jgi:hypothetical protein
MFALEKLRRIDRKRVVAAVGLTPANDNHNVERRARRAPGRTALVGRWRQNVQTGRLEWNWSLEAISGRPEFAPAKLGTAGRPLACEGINNSTGLDHRRSGSSRKSK